MKEIKLTTAVKNLRSNLLLLLSAVFALCLFITPSIKSTLVGAIIFLLILIATALGMIKPAEKKDRITHTIALLLALLGVFIGSSVFKETWSASQWFTKLSNTLNISENNLSLVAVLIVGIAGFYAMYIFSSCLITLTGLIKKEKRTEQQKAERLSNFKRNWYFPFLSVAFFFLSGNGLLAYYLGLPIAFGVMIAVAQRIPSIWDKIKEQTITLKLFCAASAIGICLGNMTRMSVPENLSVVVLTFICIIFLAAAFFAYICLIFFWDTMLSLLKKSAVFQGVTRIEAVIYAVMLLTSIVFMMLVFARTQAFYGTDLWFDIIYTSDSPYLVKDNVYLALTHQENDLRQPLFAVFAAPFIGFPYLLGKLLDASAAMQAILINIIQLAILFAANFMLTKIMKLSPLKRVCFMLLSSITYTNLLFLLMMEQYIVAYFWLIFFIYLICDKQQVSPIVLWGAGGTLLTSMILLPLTSENSPNENFKEWLRDVLKRGMEYVLLLIAFCRFDVIFYLTAKITYFGEFTGNGLSMMEKLNQYTTFIKNCFAAPAAGIDKTTFSHVSWQLNSINGINFAGVAILLLVIISVVVNQNKKSSLISAGWVGFSMVLLIGLGWGTNENGLILYALYFGWAFLVLLFQLVEKIEAKLNVNYILPTMTVGIAIVLSVINIPAIMDMIRFAITYYPK